MLPLRHVMKTHWTPTNTKEVQIQQRSEMIRDDNRWHLQSRPYRYARAPLFVSLSSRIPMGPYGSFYKIGLTNLNIHGLHALGHVCSTASHTALKLIIWRDGQTVLKPNKSSLWVVLLGKLANFFAFLVNCRALRAAVGYGSLVQRCQWSFHGFGHVSLGEKFEGSKA